MGLFDNIAEAARANANSPNGVIPAFLEFEKRNAIVRRTKPEEEARNVLYVANYYFLESW